VGNSIIKLWQQYQPVRGAGAAENDVTTDACAGCFWGDFVTAAGKKDAAVKPGMVVQGARIIACADEVQVDVENPVARDEMPAEQIRVSRRANAEIG
jgi:hypothetical protein